MRGQRNPPAIPGNREPAIGVGPRSSATGSSASTARWHSATLRPLGPYCRCSETMPTGLWSRTCSSLKRTCAAPLCKESSAGLPPRPASHLLRRGRVNCDLGGCMVSTEDRKREGSEGYGHQRGKSEKWSALRALWATKAILGWCGVHLPGRAGAVRCAPSARRQGELTDLPSPSVTPILRASDASGYTRGSYGIYMRPEQGSVRQRRGR